MLDDVEKKSAALREQGNDEYRQGKYADAVVTYTKSIEVHPSRITFGNRAQANFRLNTLESLNRCMDDSTAAVELDSSFSKGYFRLASAALKLGKLSTAKEVYNRSLNHFGSLEKNEENTAVITQTKTALEIFDKVEKSLEAYEKIVKNKDSNTNIVDFLTTDTEKQSAVELLRTAAAHVTHDINIILPYVTLLSYTEGHDEIISQISFLMNSNPFRASIELLWFFGLAYYELSLVDEAEDAFSRLHRVDANYLSLEKKRRTIASLRVVIDTATTYSKGGKFDWAQITLTKAIESEGSYSKNMKLVMRTHRAIILMYQCKYREAIDDCNISLSDNTNGPWKVRAYQCRGYCFEATDDVTRAIKDYECAVEISPDAQTRARIDVIRKIKPRQKDYYGILGVTKNAPENEIKKAYRHMALVYHPDKIASASADEKERMKDMFQDVQEAYSIISDPSKRERYDRGETRETIDGPEADPLVFFNLACGTLPEDASSAQKCLYDCKKVCFWSSACLLATVTCPCWCSYYCLQDRNQYKSEFEKHQQEYKAKHSGG